MKLKLKKEKISDVQKALDSGSSELTFQDFRDALKGLVKIYRKWFLKYKTWILMHSELMYCGCVSRMGHSDQEITDAFARFDQDGNQTLDKLEQEKMKQELEEKRVWFILWILFGKVMFSNGCLLWKYNKSCIICCIRTHSIQSF